VKVFDATQQGRAGESSRVWISRLLLWLVLAAGAALSVRAVFRTRLSGEGSWFPMSQALDLLRRVPDQRLYETLSLSRHVKFQDPPCACYAKLRNRRGVVGGLTALGGVLSVAACRGYFANRTLLLVKAAR
jgi:hypothetical protein